MVKAVAKVVAMTDAEIDAAIAEGKRHRKPGALAASFNAHTDTIEIRIENGMELRIPRHLIQGLEGATPQQLAHIELEGSGIGLFWPDIDVAHYLPDLMAGEFGTRRWMAEIGRRGGARRSKVKAAAARANGAKGGRPRRRKPQK